MATTIITKNGTGAPLASDLVAGELAVDLTNKRLYTEDSGGTIIEVGTNPSGAVTFNSNATFSGTAEAQFRDSALKVSSSVDGQLDIDADVELEITAPTVDIDASTAVTIDTATLTVTGAANVTGDLDVDNININGNAIISTNTNGNIDLTPNGTGEVNISKVDIDAGAIDGTAIGANSASTGAFTTLSASGATTLSTTLGVTGATTLSSTLGVTGESTLASAIISDLTSGRVVLAGTSGAVEDSGNLTFDGTTLAVTGAATVSTDLTVSGNTTLGNAATDTVTVTADVASNLIPSTDDTYDLGASGSEWKDLYIDGTANVDTLVIGTSTGVTSVDTDLSSVSASDDTLASAKAIKTYVDSQVGANNELSEVLANGNTTGSTNIVVTAGQSITTDSILETTAAAGVDIDGVLLKDTSVGTDDASGTDVAGTAVTVKGGAGTGTGAGGSLVFQTAPAGSTGSTPNAQVTALTIDSAGDATFTADVNVTGALSTTGVVNFDGINSVQLRRNTIPGAAGTGSNLLDWQLVSTGSTYVTGARIQGLSDGAWSASSAPMYLTFGTVAAGAVTLTERLRIESDGGIQFFADNSTEFVINNSSSDSDFRVESDTNTHMLFVDGGANHVNVGTAVAPQGGALFHVRRNASCIEWGHGNSSAGYFGTLGAYGNNGHPYIGFSTEADTVNLDTFSTYGHKGSIIKGDTSGNLIFAQVTNANATLQTPVNRLTVAPGEFIVNDASNDYDFRVESDGASHMLFVDGGNNSVAINASNPSADEFRVATTANFVTTTGTDPVYITRTGGYDQALKFYTDDTNSYIDAIQDEADLSYGGLFFRSTNGINSNQNLLYLNQQNAVFNEGGADIDFRVESVNNDHALFVDAGNDRVTVGGRFAVDEVGGSGITNYRTCQMVTGEATAAASNVYKDIVDIGFTAALNVRVIAVQTSDQAGTWAGSVAVSYGGGTTGVTAEHYVGGNITEIEVQYDNTSSTIQARVTYTGTAPTIYWTVDGMTIGEMANLA